MLFPVIFVRTQQKKNQQCTQNSSISCLRLPDLLSIRCSVFKLLHSYQNSHAFWFHRMLLRLFGFHLYLLSTRSPPLCLSGFSLHKTDKIRFQWFVCICLYPQAFPDRIFMVPFCLFCFAWNAVKPIYIPPERKHAETETYRPGAALPTFPRRFLISQRHCRFSYFTGQKYVKPVSKLCQIAAYFDFRSASRS